MQEGAAYPLVWRHPDTDVGAIMAHTLILECLRSSDRGEAGWELSWEESEAEVASLLEAATQPPHILVHNWRPRDLVIWCAPAPLAAWRAGSWFSLMVLVAGQG